jgi:predicted amidohydrolase
VSSEVTIACAQLAPRVGEVAGNRCRAQTAIETAVRAGARLVVLPELCTTGYVFADAAEAHALSEPVDGPTVREWSELSAREGLVIVAGLCELDDDGEVRNSAVVIDAGELRCVHRKAHLWDREQVFFKPGDCSPPVVSTSIGRIGVTVCYDAFFPEVMRVLALAGADVIAIPMNAPVFGEPLEPLVADLLLPSAAAIVNRVFIAQADRTGTERGVDWVGASVILDVDGRMLTDKADGEAVLTATVDLALARDKNYGERNNVLTDRRPELYEPSGVSDVTRAADLSR